MGGAAIQVVLEIGTKRVFASAVDWPGWSRSGRDEDGAIDALGRFAPRYAAVVAAIRGGGRLRSATSFEVIERLRGGSGTDFGAPGVPPAADAEPINGRELDRIVAILRACWDAFDASASTAAAGNVVLRTGPRGGGRSLGKIREHVEGADGAYLRSLGGTTARDADHAAIRAAFVDALYARARGELPDVGPRGGMRWTLRFGVRYAAWHTLDHAWEIEDRGATSTAERG